jgi:hypothetical protein
VAVGEAVGDSAGGRAHAARRIAAMRRHRPITL